MRFIRELWKKGSRRTLRDMLSATFLIIDLRTDGKDILWTIYLPDIPAFKSKSPGEVASWSIAHAGLSLGAMPLLPLGQRAQVRWLELR